jgi:hypothetical protein
MSHRFQLPFGAALLALAFSTTATASFHLMQIEQVIGGYCGDPAAQGVQLRMRTGGQNLVSGMRLVAHDAAGSNPVILITFPENVSGNSTGSRILAATADFATAGGPEPDFTLSNPIPPAYLEAGKITFETGGGFVYWSLAWGGASYTGTNTSGDNTNDADGNFNPPFPGALPYNGNIAVRFTGAATAQSTNNAADYAPSASPATFTNNDGTAGVLADCVQNDGFEVITD